MPDTSIQAFQPNDGALSAEHYQTFELAKENDSVLGGDNIAQIRSYAAYARAQAQAIHKTIAATNGIDDVAAIKSEATETAQTFAKVGIYADQRIGEILRELPKSTSFHGNQHKEVTSDAQEVTKASALQEANISKSQAYDLEKLAANPEIVELVITNAEVNGTIPSRKQVLDAIREREKAIRERDEARDEAETHRIELAEARREVAALEKQNDKLYEQAHPESQVVTREVESEATRNLIKRYESESKRHAEEYESLSHRYESVKSELDHVRKAQEDGVNTPHGDAFADALGELVATRHRYSHVAELADVFAEIDMLASQSLEGGSGK